MNWNTIIGDISKQLPQPNQKLMEFREERISQSKAYFDKVFVEMMKLFEGKIVFKGHRVLRPEECSEYILKTSKDKTLEMAVTEAEYVEYLFEFNNVTYRVVYKIPYMVDGVIVINNTVYNPMFNIAEPPICRSKGGLSMSVMRARAAFRTTPYTIHAEGDKTPMRELLITANVYFVKKKMELKTVPLMYLVVVYGVDGAIRKLGFDPKVDMKFVTKYDPEDKDHKYYKCNTNVYLKVKNEVIKDRVGRSTVVMFVYMLSFFKKYTVDSLYGDNRWFWEGVLGKSIRGLNISMPLAAKNARTHIDSLNTYLDASTRQQLQKWGLECENIYDVFTVIIKHMDSFMAVKPNDLFQKRITVEEALYYKSIVALFKIAYKAQQTDTRSKRGSGEPDTLQLSPKGVASLFKRLSRNVAQFYDCQCVRLSPPVHGDNFWLAYGKAKVRYDAGQSSSTGQKKHALAKYLTAAESYKLHPSMCYIEGILGSGGFPAVGGSINPFMEITDEGNIVKPKTGES